MAKDQNTVKSKKWIPAEKVKASIAKNLGQSKSFFISRTRQAFSKLRQVFLEAPILNYFDLEHHIQIETNASNDANDRIFRQMTLDDLGQ